MPRSRPEHAALARLDEILAAVDPRGRNLGALAEALSALRAESADASGLVDRSFLERLATAKGALGQARAAHQELAEIHERLTAPPLHPALYLEGVPAEGGPHAMVIHGPMRRVVRLGPGVAYEELERGAEVLLNDSLNAIVAASPFPPSRAGETASFERLMPDGRLVLRCRDEELVVDAVPGLDSAALEPGDLVRWCRTLWLAFERVARGSSTRGFLEEMPRETFADIGGLDPQIERLKRAIGLHLHHAEVAARYRLPRRSSVLLVGPPGTGKTMLAKAFANWLGELSPSGRARFLSIKPGELHSSFYSESERNYREAFRRARKVATEHPDETVVMFFDEVDAIAGARGQSHMRVDDRVLNAFMTELDGLEARGNILVIAATNRREALDPAVLRPGRLGDETIEVPRPNRAGTRSILEKVLPPGIPYRRDGGSAEEAREAILEATASRIFAPNGHGEIATITLRDGARRPVLPADVVSGARLANVARVATERACFREVEEGPTGIGLGDVLEALTEELDAAARVLTPANCRNHVEGLPDDAEVVRVERIERPARHAHRYLRAM